MPTKQLHYCNSFPAVSVVVVPRGHHLRPRRCCAADRHAVAPGSPTAYGCSRYVRLSGVSAARAADGKPAGVRCVIYDGVKRGRSLRLWADKHV